MASSEAVGMRVAELKSTNTPESLSLVEERIDIVRELIAHGADPRAEDTTGFQASHAAILSTTAGSISELVTVLRILVDAGADINVPDGSSKGMNVLHYACAILHSGEYSDEGDEEHVLEVIQRVVSDLHGDLLVPSKDSGKLPIHYSAERGHIQVVRTIIHLLTKANSGGDSTPASLLASLLDDNGNNVLHTAAMKKRTSLMQFLQNEVQLDPTLPNAEGKTAQELYEARPQALYTLNASESPNQSDWNFRSLISQCLLL